MADLKLPTKLHDILFQKQEFASDVISNLKDLLHVLENNNLYFFPEYTDHSIRHVEGVLTSIENLMTDDTIKELTATDVGVLVTAVVLHDIGMLTNAEMFKNMISGKYDNISGNWFKNEPTWKELWEDYLKESQYWNTETRENNTGDPKYIIKVIDKDFDEEANKDTLTYKIAHSLGYTDSDRRYVGEFIRRHHARLAYDVALKGYGGDKPQELNSKGLPRYFMQLAGLIARSHGMNVRDTYDILKEEFTEDSWNYPINIKVILLMILIRIADYLQIDPERTDPIMLNLRTIYSPYSFMEHEMHLSIDCIQLKSNDPERIVVQATPKDAQMYVKIERLITDIQHEFDLSWAILGEVYGNSYQLRYRRIVTNISDKKKLKKYDYVPKQFGFKFNNALSKLLIAPLYGGDPSYGVRELVQNAVDACRTRMALDKDYNARKDLTHVTVTLDRKKMLFHIIDSGIGMTIEEIEKYFLTIGSSYDRNIDWQRIRDDDNSKNENDMVEDINKIYRTGHFGIGILAAFLLGPVITIKTKSIKSKQGYEFSFTLDKDFIEIKKTDVSIDYGTSIEISGCYNSIFEQLEESILDYGGEVGNEAWYGWYVDSKPKVEYFYNGEPIPLKGEVSEGYRCLQPLSSAAKDFGKIYWKEPNLMDWFGGEEHKNKPSLYCNGFLITHASYKSDFSIPGIEAYIPFGIPDLMLIDTHNSLPLNLERINIDENVEYCFEEDLAIAMCKSYLIQMVAIGFDEYDCSQFLFFSKSGFTISLKYNKYSFPEKGIEKEKCFNGKFLVHCYYDKDSRDSSWMHYDAFKPIIEKHPEAFFNFRNCDYLDPHYLMRLAEDKFCSLSIDSRKLALFYNTEYEKDRIIKLSKRRYGDFLIIKDDLTLDCLINDIVLHIKNFHVGGPASPILFVIQYIGCDDSYSNLDEFIQEYAKGDMIVPYEENERIIKFSRIYEECKDDINRYRKIYNKPDFRK